MSVHTSVPCFILQMDEEWEEEEEEEVIPEAQEQEAAEFGWFNDLYVLDTGKFC